MRRAARHRWRSRRARGRGLAANEIFRDGRNTAWNARISRDRGVLCFMRRGARDRDRDRRVRVRASRAIDRASIDRAIDRSIDRSIDGARSRARASGIPAHAHFYNVCPSRFLLRRPRRRLQGDQDPSAYFLAFARRATTRGTTTRARDAIASRAIDRRREIRDIARAARIASSRRGTCDAAKGVAGSDVDDYL